MAEELILLQELNLLAEKASFLDVLLEQRDAARKLLANARKTIDRERQARFQLGQQYRTRTEIAAFYINLSCERFEEIEKQRTTIEELSKQLAHACEERDLAKQQLLDFVDADEE